MKKSNIISIAFLIFFFGTILTMYVDAKTHGKDHFNRTHELISSNKKLNHFSILVLNKNVKIELVTDSINNITESYFKSKDSLDSSMQEFKKACEYRFSNDTLYIEKTFKARVSINTNTLKEIIGNEKSEISFRKFNSDTISITSNNCKISANGLALQHLNIKATNNSDITFFNSKLESLSLRSDNSKIYSHSNKTKKLNAILKNKSSLTTSKSLSLKIDTDISSKYTIYN